MAMLFSKEPAAQVSQQPAKVTVQSGDSLQASQAAGTPPAPPELLVPSVLWVLSSSLERAVAPHPVRRANPTAIVPMSPGAAKTMTVAAAGT